MAQHASQGAQGRGGLFVGTVLVALLAAFLAGTTTSPHSDASVDMTKSGTLGAFLSDVGLGRYSGNKAETNVNVLAGQGLQSAADLVGIKTQSDQKLLYTGLAAHGLKAISDWNGDDVVAWVASVLPATVAQDFSSTARTHLDGHTLLIIKQEGDLVELGLAQVHARRLMDELVAINSASGTLYEWALANMHLAMCYLNLLQGAPVLTALRIRYGWWPPPLLNEASISGGCAFALIVNTLLPAYITITTPSRYMRCISEMSVSEFWLASTIFPNTCAIRTIQASKHRVGPYWPTQFIKAVMQIKHINLLVNALNLASKRGTTVSQHVRAVTHNLLFDEIVATACGGLGYYLAVYFFDYLFFFVPWFVARFFFRLITLRVGPVLLCAFYTINCAGTWAMFDTITHRILFLCLWMLIFANFYKVTDYAASFGGMLIVIPVLTILCQCMAALSSRARG